MLLAFIILSASLGCDVSIVTAGCDYSGSFDNGGVTLEGGGSYFDSGDDGEGGIAIGFEDSVNDPFQNCTVVVDGRCRALGPGATPPPPGTVTLADIAHLVPDLGTLGTQPDGWAPLRLPANPISSAGAHSLSATLLGAPASVRFTPVEWYWNYGDGATGTSTSGGARWESLGVAEFDPTATSHAYRERGTYTITVSIAFRAEYQVAGGPWIPIVGTLVRTGPSADIRIMSAKTVLVDEDCNRNPRGPGC